MFNDVNIDNRLRQFVNGRVIVLTTSTVVEYVDKSLKNSYTLYSQLDMPAGKMLSFCVELPEGYLTFSPNAEVRILATPEPFKQLHYDPTAFSLVSPVDSVTIYRMQIQNDTNLNVLVYFGTSPDKLSYSQLRNPNIAATQTQIAEQFFGVGKPWLGNSSYTGWVFVPDSD